MFKGLPKNERQFLLLMLSEALTIPVGLILWAFGLESWVLLLMPVVFLAWILYIVFVDSKRHWPDKSAFTRYSYLVTFKR